MKYYDIPYFRKLNTERSLTDFLSFQCYTTWIIDTNQRVLSGQKKKNQRVLGNENKELNSVYFSYFIVQLPTPSQI